MTRRAARSTPLTPTSAPRSLTTARRLAIAASATLALAASAATLSAQTIIVKDAPAGATVEVVINNTVVGTDTANANGRVTFVVPGANRADMDALIAIDSCGTNRRVLVTQPSVTPAAADAACIRRDIPGLFLVRGVSTIVFNVEGAHPRLLLRQGPFNPDAPPRTWATVPSNLMLSGGVGFGGVSKNGLGQCGTVTECAVDNSGFSLGGGAEFWFGRYVALEVGYLKPSLATTDGADPGYSFSSELDTRIFTVGGKVGVPAGPARIYGRGGMNRQRSLSSITQKIDDLEITVDEVTTTITGGTQVFELQTQGYGWYFGAGVELWLSRQFAPYFGFDFHKLKGTDLGDGEGILDDRHLSINVGIRLHLGK